MGSLSRRDFTRLLLWSGGAFGVSVATATPVFGHHRPGHDKGGGKPSPEPDPEPSSNYTAGSVTLLAVVADAITIPAPSYVNASTTTSGINVEWGR